MPPLHSSSLLSGFASILVSTIVAVGIPDRAQAQLDSISASLKVPTAGCDFPGSEWKLIWNDEFDGQVLDSTKWSYRGVGPRESAVIAKDCVALDGQGVLHLWVRERDGVLQNGMIGTQGKFAPKFGLMAARIQFPRQEGQHGSFWMQPAHTEKAENDAARTGAEVDIIEWFGAGRRDGGTASNIYWPGTPGEKNRVGWVRDFHHLLPAGQTWSDDFHVYSVEWTPSEYIFRIDNHETFRIADGVSHQPQYLILSLLTADWEAGRLDRGKLPNSMAVDWVRVWQKDVGPGPQVVGRNP